jgi:hypothetical protein
MSSHSNRRQTIACRVRSIAFLKVLRTLPVAFCLLFLSTLPLLAWVYPEHRDIAVLALQRLDPDARAVLDKLWSDARAGHETRLCFQIADPAQGEKPPCIDYAAWAAIAGDHSCSARDMLGEVLDSPWIPTVAAVAARLKAELAAAARRDQRENAVRDSDLALLRADPEYVTRAASNDAHFLLARTDVAMTPEAYAHLALGANAPLNALASYMWYYLRALAQAAHHATGAVAQDSRAQDARTILADEAFALHFLEDSFAAGHITGSWGNSAVRKGTHDYYGEKGLAVSTWDNHRFVAMGDAYMTTADADRAALAATASLAQLVSALQGKIQITEAADFKWNKPEEFDVCHAKQFSAAAGQRGELQLAVPIVSQTPIPALGEGKGELPRFRSELGPFIGLSTGLNSTVRGGGFANDQNDAVWNGGLDVAARVGVGLEGVLNESSDGLLFLDLGFRQDSPTQGGYSLPGRGAISIRWRAPYWLIPGDIVVAAPILAFTSPQKLQKLAVQAANGGLIPWQAGINTRVGRFQFMLGREMGLGLYGYNDGQQVFVPTPGIAPLNTTLIRLRSIRVDVPFFEWRLFRKFSTDQSSAMAVQFQVGLDTPTDVSIVQPVGAPKPHLHTVGTGGVRVVFDWRHYFNTNK